MTKLIVAGVLALSLSGCGFTAALQGAGAQIGPAVGAIDSDIFAIAVAKYKAAQMFKAEVDGTIQLPPLPPPVITPPPVIVVPPGGQLPPRPPGSPPPVVGNPAVFRHSSVPARWPSFEELQISMRSR
jgi:hypothetical protein